MWARPLCVSYPILGGAFSSGARGRLGGRTSTFTVSVYHRVLCGWGAGVMREKSPVTRGTLYGFTLQTLGYSEPGRVWGRSSGCGVFFPPAHTRDPGLCFAKTLHPVSLAWTASIPVPSWATATFTAGPYVRGTGSPRSSSWSSSCPGTLGCPGCPFTWQHRLVDPTERSDSWSFHF